MFAGFTSRMYFHKMQWKSSSFKLLASCRNTLPDHLPFGISVGDFKVKVVLAMETLGGKLAVDSVLIVPIDHRTARGGSTFWSHKDISQCKQFSLTTKLLRGKSTAISHHPMHHPSVPMTSSLKAASLTRKTKTGEQSN